MPRPLPHEEKKRERPPAHQTLLHSATANSKKKKKKKDERKGEKKPRESQRSPSVILADKGEHSVPAPRGLAGHLRHQGPALSASVCKHVVMTSISSGVREQEEETKNERERERDAFHLGSFCVHLPLLFPPSAAELAVIIPNSIIFMNATGLRATRPASNLPR